jgi:hypothetical protein
MEGDDNKGGIGISVIPKISKEERQKYIKIEDLQSDASSRFGGYTPSSPHGFGTSSSRRTIADLLDIGGRDEVNAKVVQFIYALLKYCNCKEYSIYYWIIND